MKLDKSSIQYKILVPAGVLIAAITLCLLIIVHLVSDSVSEDYHNFAVRNYSNDVQRILEAAMTALTTASVLDQPVVIEAKKRSVLEALRLSWANNGLDGIVLGPDARVLLATLDEATVREIAGRQARGSFHLDRRGKHLHGYGDEFRPWQWTVITVVSTDRSHLYRREVVVLLPVIFLGSLLMAGGVLYLLRRVVHLPVARILADLETGTEIHRSQITEFDTIGAAINDALRRVTKKTEQCQLLHSLAVSIHENLSLDDVLNLILDRSGQLLQAELSAVALYDEVGTFKKIITRGASPGPKEQVPQGKGILDLVRLSLSPLRIDDVPSHPAFSGSFPAGHPVVTNLLGCPIFSDEGKPIGALYFGNKPGGFIDEDEAILKAISADAAIALSKAERLGQLRKFKEVIDASFDVVMLTDAGGLIRYVNTAFEAVTGHSRDEILGKGMGILKSGYHSEEFYQKLRQTIRSGSMWRGEFINKKKDGGIYYSSAIIYPIRTDEGVNYISIQRDITQEKRLYEQLLRAQKMEAIGTLAGGIAHDFNNLLTGILGYADILLLQAKGKGDEHTVKPAQIIRSAAERGADLAKKILTITRKEKLETRALDVNEIIQSAVEFLRRSIPKSIEIALTLSRDVPLIKADPTQLQQVIMNLCVNARDAMPEGGRLVIETSRVGAEDGASSGGFVKISVSDTGTGMDVETQRKIFDPFFTTKEMGRGTGLGLYIVHSVVSNHGGYINLYSEPGQGTTFNLYLPCTAAEEEAEPEDLRDLGGSGTVLVIDDEDFIRELCKDMLEPAGYRTLTAGSGAEGVNLFRSNKDDIALVILDMVIPHMSGQEVFQALKTIKPEVKVLLFSGYSHNGFAGIDTLMQSGAKGFIQKPFARTALLSAIKKILP